ncbi:hypothetical protein [Desmospora activa]|uniref:DUF1499 domain-containing protein n=1 Tax=Desmospora activa DSM 45169 TaxID=1121389 RepID=A0A2T4ZC25_9BACL|nr:hypothetical protein [Desmospora activa]PTM59428.1 hypothetical protein C8J48_2049 [Desmospora activa DSM 45169]
MSGWGRMISGVTVTKDQSKEPDLKTRYYKGSLREVLERIRKLPAEETIFRLVHVDEERGEVMLEYRGTLGITHDVVITPVAMTPIRIAVDVHVAIRGQIWDVGGWNRNLVGKIYKYLDRHLTPISGAKT